MNRPLAVLLLLACAALPAAAHHGVASPGMAGLSGPGAPLETTSTATLPAGSWLGYAKLDRADFTTDAALRDGEGDVSTFWMFGLGYGATPWLSLYAFAPYQAKVAEDNSFNTAGFADPSLLAVAGFVWDGGLRRVAANESLDDCEDWHLSLWAGGSLPLGDADLSAADGSIDPGLALGFGEPSWQSGLAVSRLFADRWTAVAEISRIGFSEHAYADGQRVRFGTEWRVGAALCARLWSSAASSARLDLNLEGSWLKLGRDEADGVGEAGTGGGILYALPGLRLTRGRASFGLGLKLPTWTDLNEDALQQGAEGKESSRLLVTFSTLF